MSRLMKGFSWHERCNAKDRKGKPIVEYPVWVEPKIDEIRCHFIVGTGFVSYAGKPLWNLEPWLEVCTTLCDEFGIAELDMGVLVNDNFNDSYRWVRSKNGVPEDLHGVPVKFHLYGIPEYAGQTLRSHYNEAQEFAKLARAADFPLVVLEHVLCATPEEVESAYAGFILIGCEGAMVKQPDATYERRRTDGWLKMKPSAEQDGQIVGFEDAICGKDQPELGLRKGDNLERIGSVLVHCEDGSQAAPHGIPHDLGADMYHHPEKYLGQWVEFRFMEKLATGGYRHPTFSRFREAKA